MEKSWEFNKRVILYNVVILEVFLIYIKKTCFKIKFALKIKQMAQN